jgi:hypothetical protein
MYHDMLSNCVQALTSVRSTFFSEGGKLKPHSISAIYQGQPNTQLSSGGVPKAHKWIIQHLLVGAETGYAMFPKGCKTTRWDRVTVHACCLSVLPML